MNILASDAGKVKNLACDESSPKLNGFPRNGMGLRQVVRFRAIVGAAGKAPGWVDFGWLRRHVSMEQVLRSVGHWHRLRGDGLQRRGPCPIHQRPGEPGRTLSIHAGKGIFRCFDGGCGASGNVLDLWAAIHRVPLTVAARQMVNVFRTSGMEDDKSKAGARKGRARDRHLPYTRRTQ